MSTPTSGSTGSTAIRSPLLQVAARAEGPRSNLLESLLREQQSLTAVERFARKHEEDALPAQSRYYRDLIPLERPRPGQQYAFEVDLDACTGCKACVAACHSLNGLEETEIWRTVGLLHGGTVEAPAQQTVTTACHHCVDPACMHGCPVKAYEKDPITGIVRHLDDQCIGCQYCTLMCPYDAPKYSPSKGIVRKCDMCSQRLAADEAPACVQGCPNEAIRIRVVDQVQSIQTSETGVFLPGAPAPDHTVPTTVYKTARPVAKNLLPADFYAVSPEHSHAPLVVLLTLTQLAVGAFVLGILGRKLFALPTAGPWGFAHAAIALGLAFVALGASTLHLGRPQYAWRALLGLRTSWMSREALAFGAFAGAGTVYALSLAPQLLPALPGVDLLVKLRPAWEVAAALTGLAGVFCSVMIYVATRRTHWRAGLTGPKFFGTMVLLGAATMYAVAEVGAALEGVATAGSPAVTAAGSPAVNRLLVLAVLVTTVLKLAGEAFMLRHYRAPEHTVLKRVAILMLRDLRRTTNLRFISGAIGGIALPIFALTSNDGPHPVLGVLSLLFLLAGELSERLMFFKAAPPSRMPGAIA